MACSFARRGGGADLLGGWELTPQAAFRWSFGALCAAQAAAFGWFLLPGTKRRCE